MTPYSIPPATTVGPVCLTVRDLARQQRFYSEILGLHALERGRDRLTMGVDGVSLLILEARPDAPARPPRTTGLYHFAILLPNRQLLARSLQRLLETGYALQGMADHAVSEAIYLADPEGNGIELYRDRPQEEWPMRGGQVAMTLDPLDIDGLLATNPGNERPWDGLPTGTTIGHVHLTVADLATAEAFYHGILGFDVMQHMGGVALFVSAGGYHHHLGLNVFNGRGLPQPPPGALGLRRYNINLPDRGAVDILAARLRAGEVEVIETEGAVVTHDPCGNEIVLAS